MSGDKCAQGMYMDKGLNSEHIIRGKGGQYKHYDCSAKQD